MAAAAGALSRRRFFQVHRPRRLRRARRRYHERPSMIATATECVWFDGSVRSIGDAYVAPFTHALHYGSGVFEGIRAYETPAGTAVFRLRDPLERLFASARAYGLRIPFTVDQLAAGIWETLRANAFTS